MKYTKQGQEVEVIQKLDNGEFLVARVFACGDGEFVSEEPEVVGQVFDSAPTAKYSEQVAKFHVEIDLLTHQKRELERSLRKVKEQHEKRRKRYARYDELKNLDQFIAGEITHYVMTPRYPPPFILAFKTNPKNKYDPHFPRLLVLFGKSDGQLDWRLNKYVDDSGSFIPCVPCLSYEEAVEELARQLYARLAKGATAKLIECADEYGISISDETRAEVKAKKREHLLKSIKGKQASVESLYAELATLDGSVTE